MKKNENSELNKEKKETSKNHWVYLPEHRLHDIFTPRSLFVCYKGTLESLMTGPTWKWNIKNDKSYFIGNDTNKPVLYIKNATVVGHYNNTELCWGVKSNVFDPYMFTDQDDYCFIITYTGNMRSIDNYPLNHHNLTKHTDTETKKNETKLIKLFKNLNDETIESYLKMDDDLAHPIYYVLNDSPLFHVIKYLKSKHNLEFDLTTSMHFENYSKFGNVSDLIKVKDYINEYKKNLCFTEKEIVFQLYPCFVKKDTETHSYCFDPDTKSYSKEACEALMKKEFTLSFEVVIPSIYI